MDTERSVLVPPANTTIFIYQNLLYLMCFCCDA
jgi:hypothetical protein